MEERYKLVLLGDAGVGKTSLVIQLTLQKFDPEESHETIADEYRMHLQVDGRSCLITFLDTGGGEKYMDMRDGWISTGDAFIIVYSVSSRSSFTRIQALHDHIQRVKVSSTPSNSQLPSALRSAPVQILIVANKTDQTRMVSAEEGRVLAEQLGCQFVETCAEHCSNMKPACSNLIQQIQRRKEYGRAPEMHHEQVKTVNCDKRSRGYKGCFRIVRSYIWKRFREL